MPVAIVRANPSTEVSALSPQGTGVLTTLTPSLSTLEIVSTLCLLPTSQQAATLLHRPLLPGCCSEPALPATTAPNAGGTYFAAPISHRAKQRFVTEMLDTVLQQAGR